MSVCQRCQASSVELGITYCPAKGSSLTPISEHEEVVATVAAGKHQVEVEDFDFSYGVYANGRRVICFAEGRSGYRQWARRNGRLADIHSLDDRLDHDVDELMA